ncbi:DNA glycosylase [Zunongwangia profunda SM-A87]|uniref:DNA glycosylase n=1 Tax=Zunongwangia profunda (strain DSM 18752 / CCTCC AB 206139 / SM-A87) TaxID=655815 RepID=D5B9S6_ZUNPS|nr:DNA-deoxyinosine glycosylase [Zunongwangia profunda]ADF54389.1 DNA glycosylase [Zunongwangia profunda SM-A87]
MTRINSFKPLVDKKSEILILGTIPGEKSLEANCYYGNAKNHFWDIIYRTLKPNHDFYELVGAKPKTEKYKLLLDNGIGLWDIIESCERTGSSDSKIKNEVLNDLHSFFQRNMNIKTVLFNGGKAQKYFLKQYSINQFPDVDFQRLNSTSTLNPNNTFEILNEWKRKIKTLANN